MKTESIKHDLTEVDNITVTAMRRKSKDWFIASVLYFQVRHRQAVTDHAMEMSRLNAIIQTERKTKEHWRTEANKYQHEAAAARNELREAQSKLSCQRQVINELGGAVSKLGDCIAHL